MSGYSTFEITHSAQHLVQHKMWIKPLSELYTSRNRASSLKFQFVDSSGRRRMAAMMPFLSAFTQPRFPWTTSLPQR